MDQSFVRNFCIIAHIDHGKSTLADRMLEHTGTVTSREMQQQLLDTMDIERERGITIKLQPVRMEWQGHILNLIDTPGHVDFTYEVSRSLAAVEGAVLLVDATQGIQAQTLANLYLAIDQNLEIIPVINKIDLPNAQIEETTKEIVSLIGCREEEVILASGKTGQGVEDILTAISKLPSPKGSAKESLRALVFDSVFDEYRGVIAYVRVVDGQMKAGDALRFAASGATIEAQEVGHFSPKLKAAKTLHAGEIGYLATGLKEVRQCRVGDTVELAADTNSDALPGYREVQPVVFVGLYPRESNDYPQLRDALDRLQLNDAAMQFLPEYSPALGHGFRVGLLGLLHLEVVQERLEREYGLTLVVTVPSVAYEVEAPGKSVEVIKNPWDLPTNSPGVVIREPWVKLDVVVPKEYVGAIVQLLAARRAVHHSSDYVSDRTIMHFSLPLRSILTDFYDKLKSVTAGYASMNYELAGYQETDVVRLDIHVAEEPVEALSSIVYRDEAFTRGKKIVTSLKETLPQQQFVLKIQALVGGKIIAAERLSALRKDVTAKLYGGDVTRKQKLLQKQKKGKKRMEAAGKGKVEVPTEALLTVLKQ